MHEELLPKPVEAALQAYAYFQLQQEYGSGAPAVKAENDWLTARKNLMRWLRRNKKST